MTRFSLRVLSLLIGANIIATSVAGCGDAAETEQAPVARPSPVTYAPQSDSAMNAAVERARAELASFESVTKSPQPTQTAFGVKVALPHAGGEEHVWLAQPEFRGDSVVGIVEDAPIYVKSISRGMRVNVERDMVSDWMYLENGRLVGGYTMRVAIDRLPDDQRAEQRRAFGIE